MRFPVLFSCSPIIRFLPPPYCFSGAALTEGVEEHLIDGVPVRVTNVARTVADCFKFRNKIGLDVALEALQESWRAKRVSMDELWRFAALCRVANVMRPYMESLS